MTAIPLPRWLLEAGVPHEGRMIQIVGHNVHFYPKDPDSKAISFKLRHDAFFMHPDTTYHASETRPEIGVTVINRSLFLVVESWLSNGDADRIVIKETDQ